MKNFLFLIFIFVPSFISSQINKFEIKNFVSIDPVVQQIDSSSANQLYSLAQNWLKLVYTNPKKVIQSESENDFIRFSGIGSKVFENAFAHMDLKYTLRVDFKDNKYRLTLESYTIWNSGTGNEYLLDVYLTNGKLNKRNGKIHAKLSAGILSELNSINQSLYDFLTGKTKRVIDNW